MPQEIEVWYLLPAIRRELAKILIKEHKLSQKEVALILGLTESAVSQYVSSKRGTKITFSKEETKILKEYAEKISIAKEKTPDYVYRLCLHFRGSEFMCKLHRLHDKSFSKSCGMCKSK